MFDADNVHGLDSVGLVLCSSCYRGSILSTMVNRRVEGLGAAIGAEMLDFSSSPIPEEVRFYLQGWTDKIGTFQCRSFSRHITANSKDIGLIFVRVFMCTYLKSHFTRYSPVNHLHPFELATERCTCHPGLLRHCLLFIVYYASNGHRPELSYGRSQCTRKHTTTSITIHFTNEIHRRRMANM